MFNALHAVDKEWIYLFVYIHMVCDNHVQIYGINEKGKKLPKSNQEVVRIYDLK